MLINKVLKKIFELQLDVYISSGCFIKYLISPDRNITDIDLAIVDESDFFNIYNALSNDYDVVFSREFEWRQLNKFACARDAQIIIQDSVSKEKVEIHLTRTVAYYFTGQFPSNCEKSDSFFSNDNSCVYQPADSQYKQHCITKCVDGVLLKFIPIEDFIFQKLTMNRACNIKKRKVDYSDLKLLFSYILDNNILFDHEYFVSRLSPIAAVVTFSPFGFLESHQYLGFDYNRDKGLSSFLPYILDDMSCEESINDISVPEYISMCMNEYIEFIKNPNIYKFYGVSILLKARRLYADYHRGA